MPSAVPTDRRLQNEIILKETVVDCDATGSPHSSSCKYSDEVILISGRIRGCDGVDSDDKTHKLLREFRGKLDGCLVVNAMKLLDKSSPLSGLQFFIWLGCQTRYQHVDSKNWVVCQIGYRCHMPTYESMQTSFEEVQHADQLVMNATECGLIMRFIKVSCLWASSSRSKMRGAKEAVEEGILSELTKATIMKPVVMNETEDRILNKWAHFAKKLSFLPLDVIDVATAIVVALKDYGQYSELLEPFFMMRSSSLVTDNICTYALVACKSASFFEMGKEIVKDGIERGIEMDRFYGILTIGFLAKMDEDTNLPPAHADQYFCSEDDNTSLPESDNLCFPANDTLGPNAPYKATWVESLAKHFSSMLESIAAPPAFFVNYATKRKAKSIGHYSARSTFVHFHIGQCMWKNVPSTKLLKVQSLRNCIKLTLWTRLV